MGRHAAADGAGVHPIVAAALQRHPAGSAGALHAAGRAAVVHGAAQGQSGPGWPGPPHDGTGLGWPEDERTGAPAPERATDGYPAQPGRPRLSWRWLFGRPASPAVGAPQDTSAA